ncbi:hypothetical protein LY76DRAFT_589478 [Colletotrichum caudatum]|nr:hypothetical protein LY76DRAFT_589478 [Colletotrichum caudatum]
MSRVQASYPTLISPNHRAASSVKGACIVTTGLSTSVMAAERSLASATWHLTAVHPQQMAHLGILRGCIPGGWLGWASIAFDRHP